VLIAEGLARPYRAPLASGGASNQEGKGSISTQGFKTAMPEREWARLYSEGNSPEEAARHAAETYSYSTRGMRERRKR